jgi:glycosyltransferase involved in cell wall biosynthesis
MYLQQALQSLVNQSDQDFDVVISDNSTDDLSRYVQEQFLTQLRIQYLKTEGSLSMVANWNHAISQATGRFVAVMIDKTVWNPNVVAIIRKTVILTPDVDVISWNNDSFTPFNSQIVEGWGTFASRTINYEAPRTVQLIEQLNWRRKFECARTAQSPSQYTLGKICFGAYSTNLVEKIKNRHQFLFHAFAPDYTSMVLASVYSKSAIQLGYPLQISFNTTISNGYLQSVDLNHMLSYWKSVDETLEVLNRLPIPGVFQSIENAVAHDLTRFDSEFDASVTLDPPNNSNLMKRIANEIRESGVKLDRRFLDPSTLELISTALLHVKLPWKRRIINSRYLEMKLRLLKFTPVQLVASKIDRDKNTYEKDTVRKKFIDFENLKSIKKHAKKIK